ncbi:hypothetical protein L798_09278 [Zootermopsis nevadensis]|uniref:Uncharacterized protein n=2 Tax=Zootermopsis nevadensis TaxID=136037 RepID=A0A067R1G8_ZOONE|nr:hypothetical protein L798_09278 [Zootermopsis nevadensis]
MGITADDLRQQATTQGQEKANFSSNSNPSNSNNSEYRSEASVDCNSPSGRHEKCSREEILKHQQQQCQRILLLRRRESLLDITVRTVNLIRRNQQLQHRLAALQAETRAFVRSVLNNPENRAIRELTLKSRRKSRSEDENEDNGCKRARLEASATSTATTTTTTTTTTAATTTTSVTTVKKNQTVSEHNNNEK